MAIELEGKIGEVARALGADFYGVADLSPAREAILAQGGPLIAAYPRAISIGIALLHAVVDQLAQRDERVVAITYRHHAYDLVNVRLDLLASTLSSVLQSEGYNTLPVAASQRVDDERHYAAFSHKMAAHLAGLGWIGKSCLLVTPQAGPRVRWATILTDAPLAATGGPTEERCGACMQCVEICPVRAFTGQPFRAHEPREARFDVFKCDRYFSEMAQVSTPAVCGLCLYVCPHGRQAR